MTLRFVIPSLLLTLISVPPFAAAQAAPAAPETTIRTSADLVLVDVTVTDSHQNPLHNLSPSDFTVLEDGRPQTIKVFEEHAAGVPAPLPPAPRLDPGTFTNYSPAPTNGALDILLFDKLNTPMNAQMVVRDQVLKYLKQAPPGRRIAIFSLTTELKLLQGFTSDPEVLRALVEGKKGNAGGSPLMNDQMAGDTPGTDDAWYQNTQDLIGNAPDAAEMLANLQQFEAEQQSMQLQLRARYTLDALNLLARYLSSLPGRKNLIWFSGSFPVSILPDADLTNPFAVVASAEEEFRETVDLLTRSQVAVYPIDARGLMVEPMLQASNTGKNFATDPSAFAKSMSKFNEQTAEEHGTMDQMAEATGGRAFVNTNDLATAIGKAIDAGSNYYMLAYTPTNHNWNGNFRKIQVKLDRGDVTLAYRRGYFADDPAGGTSKSKAQDAKADANQYSAIRAAMQWGAPDPTEIVFAANVRPSTAAQEGSPAPGNQPAKKVSGPFRRFRVDFAISPSQLKCDASPDGVHQCVLEFRTFVYDADGAMVNVQINGVKAGIPAAKWADLLHRNLGYVQQISVPVKGEYYLRIGVRDANADRVGALELPVAAVARLRAVDTMGAVSGEAPAPK
ncbi:MAG: VWA domain-containing protein [Terracidiphilus sp.]